MTPARVVRSLGIIEGISYLILLFIAMPLKYGFDMPMAVKVVGMAHGVLFVGLLGGLTWGASAEGWRPKIWLGVFVASLVPFGFLFIDRALRDLDEPAE